MQSEPAPQQTEKPHDEGNEQVRGGLTIYGLMRRLGPYFRGEWVSCGAVAFLVILQALGNRAIVAVFGLAIDQGLIARDYNFLLLAATAYFILEIATMGLHVGIATWFATIGNRVLHRLRQHLVSHVQRLPASYFDRVPSGKIVTRLTADTTSLSELFNQGFLSVFSSLASMVAIVVAMLLISVKMTAFALLVAPPMIYVCYHLSARILVAQRAGKRRVSTINAYVAESVSGMRVIQLFNQVIPQRQKFETLSAQYKGDMLRTVGLYALFYPAATMFTAVTVVTALVVGGENVFAGAISTGAMVAFLFHVRDFTEPLRNILERYQLLQNSVSSGERIFSLFEEQVEMETGETRALKGAGRVTFEAVSFRYQETLPLALDQVSFEILPGQTLAVVGRTGSGKSTLISLLQRFRDPVSGTISIDGTSLQALSRESVRKAVGVVQQDVFLFRGTIAENIGLGDPAINDDRIAWAAKEAGLSRLLKMRPGGLNATVEERGVNLSLGERQLIAFARILAFSPEILVLDEATANVDSETERVLQAAAVRARKNRTSIVIAHRLSTIIDSDLVLVLEGGKVVEFGNPQALLASGAETTGHFRKMLESQ